MTNTNLPPDVRFDAFLSYSQRDIGVVRRIQSFLEDYPIDRLLGKWKKLRIYRDETDTRGGDLTQELMTALGACDCLMLCRSSNAEQSRWIPLEVGEFARRYPDRPIISLRLDDHPVDQVPEAIRDRELLHLDVRDGWVLGRPRARTRIELLRALARISGAELRKLIPWDRQRQRRWWLLVGGLAALALTMTLAAVFSAYVEKRNAHYVDLRNRGDHAILSLTSGNRASGIASLARVIENDRSPLLTDYREIYAAWQPSLEPFTNVVANVGINRILDLNGDFYVNSAHGLRRIEPNPPFVYAVNSAGDQLAVANYRGAFLYSLPDLAPAGKAESKERFSPKAIFELHDGHGFLVTGYKMVLDNDEDNPTWKNTCFLILRNDSAAQIKDTFSSAANSTTARPNRDLPEPSKIDEDSADALQCLGVSFAIDHVETPSASHLLMTGKRFGYFADNNDDEQAPDKPTITTYLVDLDTGALTPQPTAKGEAGKASNLSVDKLSPVNLLLASFPREIPESELWRHTTATQDDASDSRPQTVALPPGTATFHWADADFSAIEDAESFKRMLADELPENPSSLAFAHDGRLFPTTFSIGGNSYLWVGVCAIDSKGKAEACSRDLEFLTLQLPIVSPNRRFIVNNDCHSGADSLQLIDVTRLDFVPLQENPREIVIGVAFDSASSTMVALTENDVLWVYALTDNEPPHLTRRISLSDVNDRTAARTDDPSVEDQSEANPPQTCQQRPMAFLDSRRVITLVNNSTLVAADTLNGEILYKKSDIKAPDFSPDEIVTSPNGRFFALSGEAQVQLYHGATGAALSERADIVAMTSPPSGQTEAALDGIDKIRVENDGSLWVKTLQGQSVRRLSGLAEADIDASLARIDSFTGLDAHSGAPITDAAQLGKRLNAAPDH
jgi:hypothetical protein